ncbi:serendipity locus protein delta-like, partial [Sitodiplosis mosellana]|uniref:serendipity locus protein delta-like n=1 Tax=Sitodiplosis mosellana TaxID=263140 RepID=UPI002443DF8F
MFSLCRLCARYMEETERKTEITKLETKLAFCCGWKRSQNEAQMPQKACTLCVDQLQTCWTFTESVWAAEAQLKKLTNEPVEAEEVAVANEIEFVAQDDDCEDEVKTEDDVDPKLMSNCVVVLEEMKLPLKDSNKDSDVNADADAGAGVIDDDDDNYNDADDTVFDAPTTFSDAESTHSNKSEQKEKIKIDAEKRQSLRDPFLTGLTPEDCLEGGLISADGVAKLEKLNPTMKTMSWSDCQYKCDKCNRIFVGSHNFYAHIRSIHIDEVITINVSCFYCNSTHRREYALNKHIANAHFHHLKYRCMYCSDYYWNTRELNKHRNMHTDVVYKCELCEQTFSFQNLFYAHVSAHHSKKKKEKEAESDEQLICELCEK